MNDLRRLLFVLALAAALPAVAASGWEDLAAAERELLAPWQSRWDTLDAAQRDRLLRNTRHWLGLDEAARVRLQARIAAWDALPPAERARIRERAVAWRAMDETERQALRLSRHALQAMAPIEREQLREAFAQLGTSQKQALLVAQDEQDLAQIARKAFAYVPPEERTATLEMLRGLSAQDRARLGELARRLGPDRRAELRRELLARPREQRAAHIQQRLAQS